MQNGIINSIIKFTTCIWKKWKKLYRKWPLGWKRLVSLFQENYLQRWKAVRSLNCWTLYVQKTMNLWILAMNYFNMQKNYRSLINLNKNPGFKWGKLIDHFQASYSLFNLQWSRVLVNVALPRLGGVTTGDIIFTNVGFSSLSCIDRIRHFSNSILFKS